MIIIWSSRIQKSKPSYPLVLSFEKKRNCPTLGFFFFFLTGKGGSSKCVFPFCFCHFHFGSESINDGGTLELCESTVRNTSYSLTQALVELSHHLLQQNHTLIGSTNFLEGMGPSIPWSIIMITPCLSGSHMIAKP